MAARQIARVGDQVLRPAHWWTSTVHALLEYLHGVGFDRVPKPIRLAEDQEVLSYIPGDSGSAGWSRVIPEQGLRAFATLLREYHDAVRGFTPPADASWALSYPVTGAEALVCHGDF
ncbi:MAG: hypothetical protein JOZ47_17365, partial [Kutzneria sp.]|nr:hypothetical protein [Kutzneria sp.]